MDHQRSSIQDKEELLSKVNEDMRSFHELKHKEISEFFATIAVLSLLLTTFIPLFNTFVDTSDPDFQEVTLFWLFLVCIPLLFLVGIVFPIIVHVGKKTFSLLIHVKNKTLGILKTNKALSKLITKGQAKYAVFKKIDINKLRKEKAKKKEKKRPFFWLELSCAMVLDYLYYSEEFQEFQELIRENITEEPKILSYWLLMTLFFLAYPIAFALGMLKLSFSFHAYSDFSHKYGKLSKFSGEIGNDLKTEFISLEKTSVKKLNELLTEYYSIHASEEDDKDEIKEKESLKIEPAISEKDYVMKKIIQSQESKERKEGNTGLDFVLITLGAAILYVYRFSNFEFLLGLYFLTLGLYGVHEARLNKLKKSEKE